MVNARAIVENNPRALKLMEFAREEEVAGRPGRLRHDGIGQDRTGLGDSWRATSPGGLQQDRSGQGDSWQGGSFGQERLNQAGKVDGKSEYSPGRIVQLFSNNCSDLVNACRIIAERQLADGIDLNFGCPVPKVTRRGGGSAIPWKLDLLEQMLSEMRRITNDFGLKLSAKYRIGIDDQRTTFIDALKISEILNLDFVTLHARTAVQFYGGSADWSVFARALAVTEKLPIFLNGDIFSGADALRLLTQLTATTEFSTPSPSVSPSTSPSALRSVSPSTSPSVLRSVSPSTSPSVLNRIGLASARGALGRPWLFAEIRQSLKQNSAVKIDKTFGEILSIAETHLQALVNYYQNETLAAKSFRKHAGYYFKGFNLGPEARRQLSSINSLAEFTAIGQQLSQRDPQLQTDETLKRSKTRPQPRVHLPDGWLNSRTLR
jgi:tRNA-dihydrouridine synthase